MPEDLDAFEIRVATIGGVEEPPAVRFRRSWQLTPSTGVAPEGAVTLPQTLAIVPAAVDGTGTVRIDVIGLRSGRAVQRIHRTVAFGVGRIDLPPFALTPLCFGVECPPAQSCDADGVCRGATGTPDGGGIVDVDAGPCGVGLVACGDTCVPSDDTNCGACGVACGADERCVAGVCACGVGLVRCGELCVDVAVDAANCGACGTACMLPGATATCEGGFCRVASCESGRGDCNATDADGCEETFGSDAHCTGCGDACALARSRARCEGGRCVIAGCHSGYDDCDGDDDNGCETRLGVNGDCRSCGDSCPLARASSTCSGGGCAIASCNGGWGDCDGNDDNGCETDLGRDSDCGGCGNECPTNERCDGSGCYCPSGGYRRDASGNCLPTCGHLSNLRGIPDDGMGCCATGCRFRTIGAPGETVDCDWCCENVAPDPGCL